MAHWHTVTLVESFGLATDVKGLVFKGKNLLPHASGQFYIIKTEAPDGSIAAREYSLANVPNENNLLEFGVQSISQGVVSTHLHMLEKGRTIEVKGPLGEYFNWDETHTGPVVFIAGGTGIVPFMSIVRRNPQNKMILIGSFQSLEHIPYYKELQELEREHANFTMTITLTREQSGEWSGEKGRITTKFLQTAINAMQEPDADIFICGRTSFVENLNTMIVQMGVSQKNIQRERFG